MGMTSIYVLPTAEGMPPRALLIEVDADAPESQIGDPLPPGVLVTWSRDMGAWTINGLPVPTDLGQAITDHAQSLGVEW